MRQKIDREQCYPRSVTIPRILRRRSRPTSAVTRVLILWSDDRSANLGVRALAEGAGRLARAALGDDIRIDHQDLAPREDGFMPSVAMARADFGRPNGPIKRWVRDYDLVLDTGAGDSFADIYGWRRVFRMIYVQLAARRTGVPVALLPQTLGPFEHRWTRTLARLALRSASIVAVRDSSSADFAKRLGRRDLIRATDVVFALDPPAAATQRDVLLNVSGLLWSSDRHGSSAAYQRAVRDLIAGLQERGRTVTLLAHVLDNASPDNDVPVVRRLGEELGLEAVVPADLEEVRSAVSSASLVVGARMHACLNALSTGTPAVAWAYSRKFAPLLGDLGWPHTVDLKTSDDAAAETLRILDTNDPAELNALVAAVRERTSARITPLVQALRSATR